MATSDVQAVTKDISTIISGVAGRRSTASSKSDADESSLLKHLIAAINTKRKSEEGISTTELKKMTEALKYRTAQERLRLDYAKIDSSDRQAVYAGQVTLQKGREKHISDYFEKVRGADMKLVVMGNRLAAKSDGRDKFLKIWGLWTDPQKFGEVEKPKIAQDDPAYAETFKLLFKPVNEDNIARIVQFDENNIVDIPKTLEVLKERGIAPSEVTNFKAELEAYNTLMARQNEQSSMLSRRKEEGRDRLEVAKGHLEAGYGTAFDAAIEDVEEIANATNIFAEAMGGIIGKDEAIAAIESANLRRESSAEADWVIKYIREQLGGSDQDKIREGLAKGIGNEGFRAWAADHGWDRLGRVQTGEDGKLVLSSYVEGGDDVAALLAWKKQSLRRAGNYGLRGIDSGEIWAVELKDGTLITGRRLKRHAADPMGAIRIVTADGARVITPQEAKQASILQRPEPSVSWIDRRAKRLHNQDVARGTYARLEDKALWSSGLQDEVTLYKDVDGNYYKDTKTGEYIRQDVMEARRIRAGKGSPFQFMDEGTPYVIDPESASVYKVTQAGLEKVDEEAANAIIAKVPPPGERSLLVTGEGDDQRLVSSGDLEAAVGSAEKARLIGVPDTPEEKAQVDSLVAASMTAEGLGYESTRESPPEKLAGKGTWRAGFLMTEIGDQVTLSDADLIKVDSALEETQMKQLVDPSEEEVAGGDLNISGPRALPGDQPAVIEAYLTNPNISAEEKLAKANQFNAQFSLNYSLAFGALKDRTDLGFELPQPTHEAPFYGDEPPAADPAAPVAEPTGTALEAATRAVKAQQGENVPPTSQAGALKGKTPSARAADAAKRLKLVGKEKSTSRDKVDMTQLKKGIGAQPVPSAVVAPIAKTPETPETTEFSETSEWATQPTSETSETEKKPDAGATVSTSTVLGGSGEGSGTKVTGEDDDEDKKSKSKFSGAIVKLLTRKKLKQAAKKAQAAKDAQAAEDAKAKAAQLAAAIAAQGDKQDE